MSISPYLIRYQELDRWDVKYFSGKINSKYQLRELKGIVFEHNEKVLLGNYPDSEFKILGVNNYGGIFHAYDTLGNEIKQPYKKVNGGDFAYS